MKYILIAGLLLIFLTAVNLYSQENEQVFDQPPFLPSFANIAGMGGAFIVSHGLGSLFYNPAGFSMGDFSLTLATAGLWNYMDPLALLTYSGLLPESKEQILFDRLFSGGYGSGFSAGLGLVKSGLGIGLFFMMDTFLSGESDLVTIEGNHTMTLGFVLGYAHAFNIAGMVLSIGADIRPMARIYVPLSAGHVSEILDYYTGRNSSGLFKILADADALYGPGLAFDSGIIAELGDFSCGLSIRDIGNTRFYYSKSTFDAVIDSLLNSGLFPDDGKAVGNIYQIPMNLSIGISYHPDLGGFSKILDPEINFDVCDILNRAGEKSDPFSLLRFGVQTKFFDTAVLRGGFDQGRLSAGFGLQILVFDFNCAFFTRVFDTPSPYYPANGSLLDFTVRIRL
jgi:hypothetical protein